MKHRLKALLGVVLLASSLTACGLDVNAALPYKVQPGSIRPVPSLEGLSVTVGSKDFTENIILAYLAELALSAAGADVTDLSNISGSNSARQALLNGQIDMSWEYTGTAWISYQGNTQPIPDEQRQFDAVKAADEKQNGITWLDYSPLNDTYAFGTKESYAAAHNLKTNSDMTAFLKQHPDQAVFCVETEFASRQDGMPGVQKVYGFPTSNVKTFGTGAIYSAVASGSCNFGEIFTTDGRIAGLNLRVLDDDKKFFPQYNASVTMKQSFLEAHPALANVLVPVGKAMDNKQMIELCKQVDVDGKDAGEVARDWMISKGFIK
ncbi:glycine betaine ABC transporter substrate-binding protein [Amycolatopsis acidiphila]|uniref:Glycine betaine ABC transporter substrate-binding protein n=1 Tax=Amycolatopsis acidiphila TaxID=715473 RepID=A0A558AFW3_9PSEU|nr:glycine betaine ABC transporter substrate-binding protein [Amycolatopsis acidiphila]TVT23123.1 glycine betaine ABC transporter substrate-binding protein [Amycolatopsis acidiphila]UIJ60191.1 glycine betaine ABC transporter substrate-binding protein [Amycolatopsis acidiphila]GHG60856.1 glycine/betaine ABC transporter substrate-binding protein [Amycolatopsis acidiphila]